MQFKAPLQFISVAWWKNNEIDAHGAKCIYYWAVWDLPNRCNESFTGTSLWSPDGENASFAALTISEFTYKK